MRKCFLTAIALVIALLASCAKEDFLKPDFDDPAKISEDLRNQLSSVIILYEGIENEFEVAVDDDLCYELYYLVMNEDEADFQYTTTHGTTLNLVKCTDISFTKEGNIVRTSVIPSDRSDLYIATVWKENNPDEWYPVFLPVRDKEDDEDEVEGTKSEPYMYEGKEVSLEKRAAEILTHPIIVDTIAKVDLNTRWLNVNRLVQSTRLNDNDELEPVIQSTYYKQAWDIVESGSSKDDVTKHLTKQAGLSFSIPVPIVNILFNASASNTVIEDRSSATEKEWLKWGHYVATMSAVINQHEIYKNPSLYIGSSLNYLLNTIPNERDDRYPMNMEGTLQILKDYGVFLSTTGSFGATIQYKYERQANVSTYSLKEDAEASLGLSGITPSSGEVPEHYTIGDALMAYVRAKFKLNTTWSANLQGSFSEGQKEYHEAVQAKRTYFVSGGNCDTEPDYTKWAATDNPSSWNLISFSATQGKPAQLINIYQMIADYNSPRAKLMKQALWGNPEVESTFLSEDCPYIQAIKKEVKDVCYETVVADVVMLAGEYKDNPKTIVREMGQKKRLYHPLIINNKAGDMTNSHMGKSLEGYGFQVGCDNDADEGFFDFFAYGDHSKNWRDKTLCIYYAMDSWSECPGIADVLIASNERVNDGRFGSALSGYEMSGVTLWNVWKSANGRRMTDCALYVKRVDTEHHTPDFPYVTAISLVAGVRRDGRPHWEPGFPFASTVGTELCSSAQGLTESIYNYYWNPLEAKNLYTSVVDAGTKQVYTLGVNSSVTDRMGGTEPNRYVIKSVDSYYGPTSDDGYKVWWIDNSNGNTYSTEHYPAFFWSYKNDSSDDKNDTNACVFLNYSTTRLDPDHMSPLRVAKTFPYHEQ